MMQNHNAMPNPIPPGETIIRRYMKFPQFLLLLTGNLVQTRIDAYQDSSEGAFGLRDVTFAPTVYESLGLQHALDPENIVREARLRAVATCWYEGEYESFAMWSIFGHLGGAIAIETTVDKLRATLLAPAENFRIERVRYRPMTGMISDFGDLFFHKRHEYAYESEIRTLQTFPNRVGSKIHNQALMLTDLNNFINKIITAPNSNPMLLTSLKTVVAAIFNIDRRTFEGKILPSDLDQGLVRQDENPRKVVP